MVGKIWAALVVVWDWVRDLVTVLAPCGASLAIVLGGALPFLLVPQGQDILHRLVEHELTHWSFSRWVRIPFFFIAVAVWALSSWYWARVILYLRTREQAAAESDRRRELLREWVPRVLGTLGLGLMTLALACAAGSYPQSGEGTSAYLHEMSPRTLLAVLAVLCAGLTVLFVLFVVQRRAVMKKFGMDSADRTLEAGRQVDLVEELPKTTVRLILAGLAVAVILGLLFTFAPLTSGRIGTVPILLLTAAVWVLFGTALLYMGRRYRVPVFLFLLVAALLFSPLNDNHALRTAATGDTRPGVPSSIAGYFDDWSKANHFDADPSQPVFLVTAEGGGIRAAYWTSLALSRIEDDNPGFARHVFAASGVSGGSLGLATFAALVREAGGQRPAERWFQQRTQDVLGRDFLSPTLAKMLAPDLIQRFLFFPIPFFDRARALEDGWAKSWKDAFQGKSDRFNEPFLDLWKDPGMKYQVPSLVLNGTHVESGRRILSTNLPWWGRHGEPAPCPPEQAVCPPEFTDSFDLLTTQKIDLPLKTAVHNSARFTYVSPAGKIVDDASEVRGHVVDGGYFENTGAASLLEVLRVVKPRLAGRNPVYVLYLRNDPADDPAAQINPAQPQKAAPPERVANEALSPVRALLATRGARGTLAVADLRRESAGQFRELALCQYKGAKRVPLPLGWLLSQVSQDAMTEQLTTCKSKDNDNAKTMDDIREWLKPAARAGG